MNRFTLGLIVAIVAIAGATSASAADLYWSGDGTWDTTSQIWGTASEGPYTAATWNNGTPDSAIFEDTAGTVTLAEPITASGLQFDTAGYTITGDTLTFGAAGPITTNANATIESVLAGSAGITKTGTGTLTLSGTNTYTGGTVINTGTVRIYSDANLGAADTAITFEGSATLQNNQGGNTTIDLGARPITLNNGAIATFSLGRGDGFTTTGAVTGDGGVAIQVSGGNGPRLYLLSTNNTFTGPVDIRSGSDRPSVYVNSLADSASAITLNNGGGHFIYNSGATSPLTLDNRPIIVQGGGSIDNNSSFPMTINTDVVVNGTGNRTLGLTGTAAQGNQFNGDIGDGVDAVVGLRVDDWSLTGTNTYSGTTSIPNGKVTFLGTQALSPNSKLYLARSTIISLLTDDAGTVNRGNEIELSAIDTSIGVTTNYTIHVGNNGGATTGSTIVFGKVDFSRGDLRSGRQINFTGDNGYRLQVGDVDLSTEIRGTVSGGAQRFRPLSAPLEITGTVKQIDGNTGTYATANTLYLGGTAAGNLVSGTIADANDYTNSTNANAKPLNVYKGESSEWTLSGTNTYSGVTTVSGGTLGVTGSCDSSDVTVSNSDTRITGGGSVKSLTIDANAGFTWGYGDGGDHVIDITGGDLVLNDDWVLKLTDLGSDPVVGGQYDLFTYSGSSALGTFAVDAEEAPDWDLTSLSVVAGGGRVYITGIGASNAPGDANGNGFVDDLDLAILLGNWEQDPLVISTWALGNFTQGSLGDTDVDDNDLAVLLGNWTGPPPGGAAVPEPATLALLGLGGLSVLRRRRSCLRP